MAKSTAIGRLTASFAPTNWAASESRCHFGILGFGAALRGKESVRRNSLTTVAAASFDAVSFLNEVRRPAQVASVSKSGQPLLGSLWFLLERQRLWFSSAKAGVLPQAAKRGAPVAVIVDDFDPPTSIRQVRVRGRGQIEPHDAAVVRRIYERYLGPDRSMAAAVSLPGRSI